MNFLPAKTRFDNDAMSSPEQPVGLLNRLCPELCFYSRLLFIVYRGSRLARVGKYTGLAWAAQSEDVIRCLEEAGCRFEASGMDHFKKLSVPCVFAANHMSTLETMCLPAIIQPFKDVTFVVKESLLHYPCFGDLVLARGAIGVSRKNPREDLKKVLDEGTRCLESGTSIIIFPQGGRHSFFNPEHFNSIAVKLAKRAGVPVVPLALDTRAWGECRLSGDIGPICPQYPVRFRFGAPLTIQGSGREEQEELVRFITDTVAEWGIPGQQKA